MVQPRGPQKRNGGVKSRFSTAREKNLEHGPEQLREKWDNYDDEVSYGPNTRQDRRNRRKEVFRVSRPH
jgi:hypothetical protein